MFVGESAVESSAEETVEIRVHGVGGAPPSQLLNDPHPDLVSGSTQAGFWRSSNQPRWRYRAPWLDLDQDGGENEPDRGDRYPVEAFSWGGLTSGDSTRALWILLLPFALSNAASWMHEPDCEDEPAGSDARTRRPFQRRVSMVFNLTLTVLLVWVVFYLAVDLIAYRCGWVSDVCRAQFDPLNRLVEWSHNRAGKGGAGIVVAAASLVPLLFLGLLWWSSRASFRRYEQFEAPIGEVEKSPDPTSKPGTPVWTGADVGLGNRWFWRGAQPVRRLRSLHFSVGLLAVQIGLALVMAEVDGGGVFGFLLWLGTTLAAAVALAAAAAALHTRMPEGPAPADRVIRVLLALSWLLLSGTVLAAVILPGGKAPAELLAGCEACLEPAVTGIAPVDRLVVATYVLTAVQAALLLAMQGRARGGRWSWAIDVAFVAGLAAAIWTPRLQHWQRVAIPAVLLVLFMVLRRRFAPGKAFWGVGASAVSALAVFMIGSLWAGAGALAEVWLENGHSTLFDSPAWFQWVADSYAVLLILVTGGAIILYLSAGREGDEQAVREQFGLEAVDPDTRRRVKRVAKVFRLPRMVERADVASIVVIAAAIVFATSRVAWAVPEESPKTGLLGAVANGIVLSAPLVFVFVIRLAYRSPAGRRRVGAVWDVVTFFPRWFHPFAPPCYGERAVPQLVHRLRFFASAGPEQGAVVRAHSQGTVLTAAALIHPAAAPAVESPQVRVVTFGSPLKVLYERVFPAYFGGLVDVIAARFDGTDLRWHNMWARTDPLGTPLFGPVTTGVLDTGPVPDPCFWLSKPGEEEPPLLGHSTYWKHPQVDRAVARLIGEVSDNAPLVTWAES